MDIDWVIIGGQTNPARISEEEWVETILKEARSQQVPVFIKENAG